MKIFKSDDKLNFVDENNVFVGYDFHQQCCEEFGYFFDFKEYRKKTDYLKNDKYTNENDLNLDNYIFDKSYRRKIHDVIEEFDMADIIIFRLINKNNNCSLFLYLYNYHNGYYTHGFETNIKEKK